MVTIRQATYDLMRAIGLTTMFGNPGSTEMTMLNGFPHDFTYYLGLQEAAVVCMADGWAQTTRRTAIVNVHTGPGLGNALGSVLTAQWSRAPLVITAGQQVRAMVTAKNWLVNENATALPKPVVKGSFEQPRAQDVPATLAKAAVLARTPPSGPVFVSLPMDDWAVELKPDEQRAVGDLGSRGVIARPVADGAVLADLAHRIDAVSNPALVLGAAADLAGGWHDAIALAERAGMRSYAAPSAGRNVFPQSHPWFGGFLPFGAAEVRAALAEHDLVVVVGAPVFTSYPYDPARLVPSGTRLVQISDDPDEIARAPLGDAILGDPAAALATLRELVARTERATPTAEPITHIDRSVHGAPSAQQVYAAVGRLLPDDVRLTNEAPSSLPVFHRHLRTDRPDSYLTTPSGGLGYGLAAGVGAALGDPTRPLLAIIGDGSLHYTAPALWTAARHQVRMVTLVMANREYGILKSFAAFNRLNDGIPGLDLPGLDAVALGQAYGVDSVRVQDPEEVARVVRDGLKARRPLLVEVPIDPAIPALL
jgi:benzoylformate decarboxylase